MGRRAWALLAAALVLAACAGSGEPGPPRPQGRHGGTLVLALDREPGSLDPARAVDVSSAQVLALLHEGLVRALPDGRVAPGLAERWWVAPDGRTYRFRLRAGARFHGGRPVTARDVVASFRRLLDPNTASPRAWVLGDVEGAEAFRAGLTAEPAGIRVRDERTVELRLARPSGTLLQRLAMPAAAVVDAEALRAGADVPPGAGPFRLEAWQPGRELVLAPHAGYHGGRPYLDAVRLRVDLDRDGVLRALAAGELGAADLSPAERARLREALRWHGEERRGVRPAVYYLALNHRRRPLASAEVRQAVYRALDRRAILDAVLGPDGYVLAHGAIPPGVPGHDPRRTGLAYDPLQARQLLAQAGYPGGVELILVETPSPLLHALNARIADSLGRVGVRVRMVTLDPGRFAEVVRAGEADAFVLSWWADYLDPENFLLPLFHSAHAGEGGNRAFVAAPELDRVLEELAAVVDPDERARRARELEDQVLARVPWVPLFFPVRYWAVQPGLRGVEPPTVPHGESLWDAWWADPR